MEATLANRIIDTITTEADEISQGDIVKICGEEEFIDIIDKMNITTLSRVRNIKNLVAVRLYEREYYDSSGDFHKAGFVDFSYPIHIREIFSPTDWTKLLERGL